MSDKEQANMGPMFKEPDKSALENSQTATYVWRPPRTPEQQRKERRAQMVWGAMLALWPESWTTEGACLDRAVKLVDTFLEWEQEALKEAK